MDRKKHTVLFLASWYPTPENINHGNFIKNHAQALSLFTKVILVYSYSSNKKEKSPIIKNTINANFEEWLLEYKKINFNIPFISKIKKYLRYKKAYKKILYDLIKQKINIDAIQLNTIFPAAIILPIFKKYYKVPHSIVEHWSGYLPEDNNYKGFFIKHFTKKAIASSSKIFYVSEKQKIEMQKNKLLGNYELLFNVVNTNIFFSNPDLKTKTPLLLHVSSLVEKEKNITGILNIIKKLQNHNYKFEVVFIGGDNNRVNYYKNYVNRECIKNTVFLGEKKSEEVSIYMQKASALILFSNYEGMPVVALEALACALPVFSTNVGNLPVLINQNFGCLVGVNEEEELVKNLMHFLDDKTQFDSKKMRNYIIENASFEKVGEKLFDFYSKLLCSEIKVVNSTN